MIKPSLLSDIKNYAEANNIDDVDSLINKMLFRGFAIEKFGETPSNKQETPKIIEKEVIVEVIKEVPFEVIKEIEVIKTVEISDNTEISRLLNQIDENEKSYKENIDLFKDNRKIQTQMIMRLNKEKELLQIECDKKLAEKDMEIIKLKSTKDFYGE